MYREDSVCSAEQRLLHTDLCHMDDDVVPGKSLPTADLLANRGTFFSLAAGYGFHVVLVRRLRQLVHFLNKYNIIILNYLQGISYLYTSVSI